ncbi:MAG: hypothetical protein U1F52_21300 [Burkholderiales bacterium]
MRIAGRNPGAAARIRRGVRAAAAGTLAWLPTMALAGALELVDDAVQHANRTLQPAILQAAQPAQLLADFLFNRAEQAGEKTPERLDGAERKTFLDLKAGLDALGKVAPDAGVEIAKAEAAFAEGLKSVQSAKGNPPLVLGFTPRTVFPDDPTLKIEILGRNLLVPDDAKVPVPTLVFEQRGKAEAKFATDSEPGRLRFTLPRKLLDDPARSSLSEAGTLTVFSKSCPWWKLKLSCEPRAHRFTLLLMVVPETIGTIRLVQKVQPKALNEREYDVPLAGCSTAATTRDLGAPWTKNCDARILEPADAAWKFDLGRTAPVIAPAQLKCQGRDPPAGVRRGYVSQPDMGALWTEARLKVWLFVESDGKFPCTINGSLHVVERRREPVSEEVELARGPLHWKSATTLKSGDPAAPTTLQIRYFNGREAVYPASRRDVWVDVRYEADPVKPGITIQPGGRGEAGGEALPAPAF